MADEPGKKSPDDQPTEHQPVADSPVEGEQSTEATQRPVEPAEADDPVEADEPVEASSVEEPVGEVEEPPTMQMDSHSLLGLSGESTESIDTSAPTTPVSAEQAPTERFQAVSPQPAPPRAYTQSNPAPSNAPTEQLRIPPNAAHPPRPNVPPPARPPVPPARPASPEKTPSFVDGLKARLEDTSWQKIAVITGGVAAVLGLGYLVDLAVSSGSVARGTTVAGVDVGGVGLDEAEQKLRAALDPRVAEPLQVTAGDVSEQIIPADAGLAVDWDATLGRIDSQPLSPWTRLTSFFIDREAGVDSTVDDAALTAAVDGLRSQADRPVREGNIVFEGAKPVPVAPEAGQQIDGEGAASLLSERWAFAEPVTIPVEVVEVSVTQESVDRALAEVAVPASSADLVVQGRGGKSATSPRAEIGSILRFEPDGTGGLKPVYDVDAATNILAPQLKSTEREPKDASITLSGGSPTVVAAEVGDIVQWPKTLESLPDALRGEHRISAVYETVQPQLTTEAAEKLGVREVIGEFTTGGFSAASGVNIRLAAASLNGALVKPGDTFSLNGHTGPRGTAQGYVESGIINNGRPDTAVGGGVSQVATTLYNASYFAGMEDVDHTEHSYYISRYPEAREATVFEGAIDLEFRNPTDTGVYIEAVGGSSQLTIRMWGTKTVNVESATGARTRPTEPQTIRLPAGPDCVASTGSPGFTSSDTRIIREAGSGSEISRNTRTVKYDPVPTVECVAADAPPAQEPPPPSGGGAPATGAPAGGAPVSGGGNGAGNGGGGNGGGISLPEVPRLPLGGR